MALAPRRDLFSVPSRSISTRSMWDCSETSSPRIASVISVFTCSTALSTPLPKKRCLSPSRSSIASREPPRQCRGAAALSFGGLGCGDREDGRHRLLGAQRVEGFGGEAGVAIHGLRVGRDHVAAEGWVLPSEAGRALITAFGRLGAAFGADVFGVEPDMITFAKGVTSGAVP